MDWYELFGFKEDDLAKINMWANVVGRYTLIKQMQRGFPNTFLTNTSLRDRMRAWMFEETVDRLYEVAQATYGAEFAAELRTELFAVKLVPGETAELSDTEGGSTLARRVIRCVLVHGLTYREAIDYIYPFWKKA